MNSRLCGSDCVEASAGRDVAPGIYEIIFVVGCPTPLSCVPPRMQVLSLDRAPCGRGFYFFVAASIVEGLQPRVCLGWRGAKPAAGRDSL